MTTFLERVPVDEITDQAKKVHFARTLLSIIAFFFYGIGWIVGKVWLGFVWTLVAIKVGYKEATANRTE